MNTVVHFRLAKIDNIFLIEKVRRYFFTSTVPVYTLFTLF